MIGFPITQKNESCQVLNGQKNLWSEGMPLSLEERGGWGGEKAFLVLGGEVEGAA